MLANDPQDSAPWLKELLRFLPFNLQIILSGNVHDLHLSEGPDGAVSAEPVGDLLAATFRRSGVKHVLRFDQATGLGPAMPAGDETVAFLATLGLGPDGMARPATLTTLSAIVGKFLSSEGEPAALIVDFASNLINRADALTTEEHAAFSRIQIESRRARATSPNSGTPAGRTVVWIVNKEGDVPDRMVVGNPHVRHIPLPPPDEPARRVLAEALLGPLAAETGEGPDVLAHAIEDLTFGTDGMLLFDVASIVELHRADGQKLGALRRSIHRYKVGAAVDPWGTINRDRFADGVAFLEARVRGQRPAVEYALDIVKRSMIGLGGARRCGPRGFAFFTGPMGVGKTLLGKAMAEMLMGQAGAFTYFNMASYSAADAFHRLLGAEPGDRSFETGGELTRAIRQRPFSLVFLDEVEKAHPQVIDALLHGLQKGALVSGRGDKVYLCDTFIVLSSNLGLFKTSEDGTLRQHIFPTDPYEGVRNKIWGEIERYFNLTIDRREMLNLLAGNVVYFDFIRPATGGAVFEGILANETADIARRLGVSVALSDAAFVRLRELCLGDLSSGAHGIRSRLRWHLINPLAAKLFDGGGELPREVRVVSFATAPTGLPAIVVG